MNAGHQIHHGQCGVESIIVALRNGSATAFDHIFDQHYNTLFNFVCHYIKDETQAQDVVSDTFERFWKERARIQGPGMLQIRNYLLRIARNLCFDLYRQRELKRRYETAMINNQVTIEADSSEKEIWLVVLDEVGRLSVEHAQILTMYYVDMLSYKEISQRLQITEVAARRRKTRAIVVLRKRFEEKDLSEHMY